MSIFERPLKTGFTVLARTRPRLVMDKVSLYFESIRTLYYYIKEDTVAGIALGGLGRTPYSDDHHMFGLS